MINSSYARAYTEVLEIISHFPEDDYSKIPSEKIEFYKKNMDKNYDFKIDSKLNLSNQNISKEANSILINLYMDYFATEKQKEKINEILDLQQAESEIKKREKYNPNNVFNNVNNNVSNFNTIKTNNPLTNVKKENIFSNIIKNIKNLISKIIQK